MFNYSEYISLFPQPDQLHIQLKQAIIISKKQQAKIQHKYKGKKLKIIPIKQIYSKDYPQYFHNNSNRMQRQSQNAFSQPSQFKSYPKCINKKEARMTCLNQGCHQYAFFCLQCQDQSCEAIHRHENKADKYIAISFKEFIRRVLKQKKPIQELDNAVSTYRQTLQRLRKDINQFVQKQLKSLDDVLLKAQEVPQDIYPTIKKLKEQKYEGLTGQQMDYLWKNCGQSKQSIRIQQQTSQFIKIKEQELKAISQHFQNLNKMQIDKIQSNINSQNSNYPSNSQRDPKKR